jgi:hypothetical protein
LRFGDRRFDHLSGLGGIGERRRRKERGWRKTRIVPVLVDAVGAEDVEVAVHIDRLLSAAVAVGYYPS